MQDLAGRVAVVVGGGGGVGRGVAHGLASAGMHVIVADRVAARAERAAAEIARTVPDASGAVRSDSVDATDLSALEALRQETVELYGKVDLVVCTVGAILQRRIPEVSPAEWEWLWRTNVLTHVNVVRAFLPELRRADEGHIVLTAAPAGLGVVPPTYQLGAYATVKHALLAYARHLREEMSSESIGVSLLCPTRIKGDLAATSAAGHREAVPGGSPVGGERSAGEQLDAPEVLGPIVTAALLDGTFLVSNDPDLALPRT